MKKKTKTNNNLLKNIFNSTLLLYGVFLITCINIFNLIITKNDESLFLFILISIIVYDFNKNMIFILGIPLIIVNTLLYLKYVFNKNKLSLEGMETTDEDQDTEDEDMEDEDKDMEDEIKLEDEDAEDENMEDENTEDEDTEDEEDTNIEEAFNNMFKEYLTNKK